MVSPFLHAQYFSTNSSVLIENYSASLSNTPGPIESSECASNSKVKSNVSSESFYLRSGTVLQTDYVYPVVVEVSFEQLLSNFLLDFLPLLCYFSLALSFKSCKLTFFPQQLVLFFAPIFDSIYFWLFI